MAIDRKQFTPDGLDPAVPVVISPYCTVPTEAMALMLAGLVGPCESVLEIGTGSGYQAAVLAERCKEVVSVEVQPVTDLANKLPGNVVLIHGDGCTLDTGDTYDAVLVTFAAPRIMPSWFKQVREAGRLVVPLKIGGTCRICVYEKCEGRLVLAQVHAYANFTPMVEGKHEA